MIEIERTEKYIIYQYDTVIDYINHYEKNFQYLKDTWTDEEGYMCASYDIKILGDMAYSYFVAGNTREWARAVSSIGIDVDTLRRNIEQREIENIHNLINIALDMNDKNWFLDLTYRLNKSKI